MFESIKFTDLIYDSEPEKYNILDIFIKRKIKQCEFKNVVCPEFTPVQTEILHKFMYDFMWKNQNIIHNLPPGVKPVITISQENTMKKSLKEILTTYINRVVIPNNAVPFCRMLQKYYDVNDKYKMAIYEVYYFIILSLIFKNDVIVNEIQRKSTNENMYFSVLIHYSNKITDFEESMINNN